MDMSLTIFLAICILGIDVLIYFLYEWAFGESERLRKRRNSRFAAKPGQPVSAHQIHQRSEIPGRVVEMNRKPQRRKDTAQPNSYREAMAYRRLVSSFAPLKPRT
jgi:hypothetical protein